jgi:hypothetical protein
MTTIQQPLEIYKPLTTSQEKRRRKKIGWIMSLVDNGK